MSDVRINRFLASCGLGSRRACEAIVLEGRVQMNGRRVDSLGARVSPRDDVFVDGEPVRPDREMVVVMHKPRGLLCTRADPRGRETVYDLLPRELHHLAHVGRLDRESEGLLVLTNSGDLAQALTHPSTKVEKEYIVQLDHPFTPQDRQSFLRGLETEEGLARASEVEVLQPRTVRIVLQQGLKRQIRLMCVAVGHVVKRLTRVRIGSFTAPRLASGRWRKLTAREIESLRVNPGRGSAPAIPAPPPLKKRKQPASSGPARPPGRSRGPSAPSAAPAQTRSRSQPGARTKSAGRKAGPPPPRSNKRKFSEAPAGGPPSKGGRPSAPPSRSRSAGGSRSGPPRRSAAAPQNRRHS